MKQPTHDPELETKIQNRNPLYINEKEILQMFEIIHYLRHRLKNSEDSLSRLEYPDTTGS